MMILNIFLEKLCMEVILLTLGIEEQIILIYKFLLNLNYYKIATCHKDLTHQIQQRLIMKDINNTLKQNYLLNLQFCSDFIQMQKLDILQLLVKQFSKQYCQHKEDQREVVKRILDQWEYY